MSSKYNFKKIYILIKDSILFLALLTFQKNIYFDKRLHTFLSIVDICGNGRFTFESWFIAIAHYLTF